MDRIIEPDDAQLKFSRLLPELVLASKSENRRALIECGGSIVHQIPTDAEEFRSGNTPKEVVLNIAQSKRLYYTLCIILYLLQSVNPNHHFREQFRSLLQKYPIVNVRYMGFPEDWQEHPLWKI